MRYFLIIFIAILAFSNCKPSQVATQQNITASDTLRIANDSLEYEIIIIEPGFNSWLVTQRPPEYYSLSFLENRNVFYVASYNRRVINSTQYPPDLYPLQINYDPQIRYGLEVNYLLYNYFVYFEERYNQKL